MKSAALVVCAASVLSMGVQAAELYRQNPISAPGGLSSQDARNPGGLGWFSEVSDNFPVAGAATITRVQFWGGYAQVTPGNTQGFMIRFYNDNAGTVGSLISTQDITTFTEVADYTNGSGASRYLTTCDLTTPVSLPAAGQYWISVVGIIDRGGGSTEPQWSWVAATTLTPPMARQMFFGSSLTTNSDVSFIIEGNTGPACGTSDFNGDGDFGTDQDIEAFFACLAGVCCPTCYSGGSDFNGDGDFGTDQDIEAFFRVLAGGAC
jgi:hypothetical protein